jgi:nitrous oxide reductase accessory protein NosL
MKKLFLILLAVGMSVSFSQAEMKCQAGKCGAAMKAPAQGKKMMRMFQSVPASEATLLQQGKAKVFCPECGMTLPMFYKTNHAATVNGQVKQYCSMHCLVEDMQKGSKPTEIKVVDVTTLKFIPVEKAIYVVGSHKKGTMTTVSKYAFGSKEAAEAFAKANGGTVTDYKGALDEAKKDFAKESKIISQKQAMMAQKGEMVYGKMCQKTDKKFATVAEAKAFIIDTGLCQGLKGKQLQAVGLYLKNR